MSPLESLINDLSKKLKNVTVYSINTKTIRVDTVADRNQKTKEILALLPGSKVNPNRPNDIKLSNGLTILVKPTKGATKSVGSVFYGMLNQYDLSSFQLRSFSTISTEFATTGKLVSNIKEQSDVICVSDLNREITKAAGNSLEGITLKIHGYRFDNVIGCIPVTNGEPKADVVLVRKIDNELIPDCFISYKMGTSAKDFQNYSGLSDKSSPYIFNHPETLQFYQTLNTMSDAGIKDDVFQPIQDKQIIGMAVWGLNFNQSKYDINNCHFIAQGSVSISGTTLSYSHSHKNADFNFDQTYQPVFGARFATGRNNRGPGGMNIPNFRIGIFPRAYRTKWLK